MKQESLLTILGDGDQVKWAVKEAERLEQAARKFGFSPQKPEYRITHPLGDQKDRLRFFFQK